MLKAGSPRAVLVDDNLMFTMMVQPALKRLGCEVRALSGGAGEEIARLAPDLIFVNLASNRFSGPDLVRELRSRAELARTPIVGYAGHVERHFFQAGREAGATLVVPNSAMRKALPEVLEKLQRRLAGAAEEEWTEED